MALYHGGENDVKFVSSYPTLKDLSPTPKDVDLEEVLMGYLKISRAPFISLVVFKKISCILGIWLKEHIHLNIWLLQVCINRVLMRSIGSMKNTRLTTTQGWQLYTTQEKRFWLWPFGWCGAWIYHMWIYMYVWTELVIFVDQF